MKNKWVNISWVQSIKRLSMYDDFRDELRVYCNGFLLFARDTIKKH